MNDLVWNAPCSPFFNPPPIPHIVSFPTLSFGNLVFSLHVLPLFTPLAVPLFFLSRGHNQRMEFLGDSIMQLVATEYLFIHFPDHHEGHLTVRSNHLKHSPKAFFHLQPCTSHIFLFYTRVWSLFHRLLPFTSFEGWDFFPHLLPSHKSVIFLFFFCLFASTPLFHSPPSCCACMFTVLLVMGIVMRRNCSVVFSNTSLLAHFCRSCQVSEK